MKYIFLGTPEFAAIILNKLIRAEITPVAIVTSPDKPIGRKKIVTPLPVKTEILNLKPEIKDKIQILQPEKLDEEFIKKIKSFSADVGVMAAYGKIIPKELIEALPKGIVGVHPSLLPKYRGATPIQSVILTGGAATGTTLFLLDEKVDHGPILMNCELRIMNEDNYETLSKKLAELSGNLLIDVLSKYLAGKIKLQEQDHSKATYTEKFKTEDGFVNLNKDAAEIIWRKVRALNPEPGVYTFEDGRRMKILEADLVGERLVLKKIQFEGKKPQVINNK